MKSVTFLTGASSGFGSALAPLIAREGHAVALAARREEPLKSLAEQIRAAGGEAISVACDVDSRESVQAAVERCSKELGPVTRLVANAGVSFLTPATNFQAKEVEQILRTNLIGAVYCIEAVLPGMIERRDGQIVGIASLAGYRGLPGSAAYCASKAGMIAMLEGLRIELRAYNVAVTTICPGFVKTPMTDKVTGTMPFLMELDDAAKIMHTAIRKKKSQVTFPWPLATITKAGRFFPNALYDWVLRKTRLKLD